MSTPLTSFQKHVQYQIKSEPVRSPDVMEDDQSTTDRWYSPLSLPPVFFRRIGAEPRDPWLLPIASYETAEEFTPEAVTSDRFVKAMEDPPVRFRVTQLQPRPYLYPNEFTSHWFTASDIGLGAQIGWYSPFSQHASLHEIRGLQPREYSYPTEFSPHWFTATDLGMGAQIGWYTPFSQHTRLQEIRQLARREYSDPFLTEPPFETTSPPEPMPDSFLSTQLMSYPLPNHMPEGMLSY